MRPEYGGGFRVEGGGAEWGGEEKGIKGEIVYSTQSPCSDL